MCSRIRLNLAITYSVIGYGHESSLRYAVCDVIRSSGNFYVGVVGAVGDVGNFFCIATG